MTTRAPTQCLRRAGLPGLLFVASAATGLTPIADGDIFWHLAAGREIWNSGAWLDHDVFSSGAAGRAWIDVHWLFQLGAYGVSSLAGLRGLVIVKCVLIGASACLFYATSTRRAQPLTAALLLAALLCARHLLLLRPVIVSLLLLGLFFLQLERFRRHGRARSLLPLPFAQIIWSNCQGLFALGPALIAAYALGLGAWALARDRRSYPFAPENVAVSVTERLARFQLLLAALACSLLASLVTPFGLRALGLPLALFSRIVPLAGNPFQSVAENVPPFVLERASAAEIWHLKWFLGAAALALAARRGRIRLSQLLWLSGFLALALISNRNVLLLYVVAAPLLALQLSAATLRWRVQVWSVWPIRALLVALVSIVGTAAAREPSIERPTPFHFPVESARAIGAHHGRGKIFSADFQGGYLIWKLYPAFRPYYDTRWILRTQQEFRDYLALVDDPLRFDAFQQREHFDYVVLPVAYPDRYLRLISHLYRSDTWRLVFTDGSEVLFARDELARGQGWELGSPRTTDHILRELTRKLDEPRLRAAARIQLATLDVALHEPVQAQRVLAGMTSAAARPVLARSRLLAGDLAGAEQLGQQLLTEDRDDARNHALMAQVSLGRRQLPSALGYLRRALVLDPFDDEATNLLRTLEEPRTSP